MIEELPSQNYFIEEMNNLRHSQNVIEVIINYLNGKLIRNEKINQIVNYMQSINNASSSKLYFNYSNSYKLGRGENFNSNYDSNFKENNIKEEIFNIIEDFNNVIHQSIQAVRTLQYENLNLKEVIN
jgi:hypothetical protein